MVLAVVDLTQAVGVLEPPPGEGEGGGDGEGGAEPEGPPSEGEGVPVPATVGLAVAVAVALGPVGATVPVAPGRRSPSRRRRNLRAGNAARRTSGCRAS